MKNVRSKKFSRLYLLPIISFMVLGLNACEAPKTTSDYRATHKVSVQVENLSMEISGTIEKAVQSEKFIRIIREFHIRANGPIAIEIRRFGQSEEKMASDIQIINTALRGAGIQESQIIVLPTPAGNDLNAVLSFSVNSVQVPECEDWSTSSSFNWSNTPQGNYGCSTIRNIGLMIANPGDLETTQPMTNYPGGWAIMNEEGADAPADE